MDFSRGLVVAPFVVCSIGCAQLQVVPLDPSGKEATDKAKGIVYYLPKPYLVVARLPPKSSGGETRPKEQIGDANLAAKPAQKPAPKPAPTPPDNKPAGASDDKDTKDSIPSTSPNTNSSFEAANAEYRLKVIYLPDYSRPMAIRSDSGLIGTASIKPVLQDGWMLTSLDGTTDNKVADLLNSVASIIGATKGAGASSAGGKKGADDEAQLQFLQGTTDEVLRPGLYEFRYDANQRLTLCAVAFFTSKGLAT